MWQANYRPKNNRSTLQERTTLGWEPIDVQPGEHLVARINGTPGQNRIFRLLDGVHELWTDWTIASPCTIVGSRNAVVLLKTDGIIHVTSQRVTLDGFTVRSEVTAPNAHTNYMVRLSASLSVVRDLSFEGTKVRARGAALCYPLYLDDAATISSVRDCDFFPEVSGPAYATRRQVYLEDSLNYCSITGCRLFVDLTAGPPRPRHLISMKQGLDNEAGSAAVAPAGTYRSFCNFADVELR